MHGQNKGARGLLIGQLFEGELFFYIHFFYVGFKISKKILVGR